MAKNPGYDKSISLLDFAAGSKFNMACKSEAKSVWISKKLLKKSLTKPLSPTCA
jgi:hypothetical protein